MRPRIPTAIEVPVTVEELGDYYRFRWKLLRAPWDQPPGSEKDAFDAAAHHLLARNEAREIVAVGRVHFPTTDQAQIRFMATSEDYRGLGIGSAILASLEKIADHKEVRTILLNARTSAVSFYEHRGYAIQGEGPTLFGRLQHKTMTKAL
jgi:predicted GNAT family N-acyltransferase